MSEDWRELAAQMIEAGRFAIAGNADDATVRAASFVFDEGILYLPPDQRQEVVKMLRTEAKRSSR